MMAHLFAGPGAQRANAATPTHVGVIEARAIHYPDPAYSKVCEGFTRPGANPECRAYEARLSTAKAKHGHLALEGALVSDLGRGGIQPRIFRFAGQELAVGDVVEITGELDLRRDAFTRVEAVRVLDRQVRLECSSLPGAEPRLRTYFLRGEGWFPQLHSVMRTDIARMQNGFPIDAPLAVVYVPTSARSSGISGTQASAGGYYWISPYLKDLLVEANPGQGDPDAILPRPDVLTRMSLSAPRSGAGESAANAELRVEVSLPGHPSFRAASRAFDVSCRPIEF